LGICCLAGEILASQEVWKKDTELKENLQKAAREVLGEEIEVSEKQRKQLYIDADLEKLISKKKKNGVWPLSDREKEMNTAY